MMMPLQLLGVVAVLGALVSFVWLAYRRGIERGTRDTHDATADLVDRVIAGHVRDERRDRDDELATVRESHPSDDEHPADALAALMTRRRPK